MLKDEVKKYKELETVTGGCRFCGQVMQVEAPPGCGEDVIEELVAESCSCTEAQLYEASKRRQERAHEKIELLFGEQAESPVDGKAEELLHIAVDAALAWDIEKLTVEIGDGTKGKISRSAKGNIKIERSESRKKSVEL